MPVRGTIVVNELLCKGCELCVGACPQDVMHLAERLNSGGYHPAELKAQGASSGCTGCGICAIVCPEAAITVYRETLQAAQVR